MDAYMCVAWPVLMVGVICRGGVIGLSINPTVGLPVLFTAICLFDDVLPISSPTTDNTLKNHSNVVCFLLSRA